MSTCYRQKEDGYGTHHCDLEMGHDGDHVCRCKHTWRQS